MRIGLVLAKPPGYSETFFRSKIKGLQKDGFQVVLFVQEGSPDFNLCQVRIFSLGNNLVKRFFQTLMVCPGLILILPRVIRFVQLEKAEGAKMGAIFRKIIINHQILKASLDWLHFGFATMALGKEQVAKTIGAKMAVSFRGFDINVYPIKNPHCYRALFKNVDKVHSISRYLLEKAYTLGLSKTIPYQMITPAVNLEELPHSRKADSAKMIITTVARLHWIKGLETALKAVSILKNQGINVEYHIIGDGDRKSSERYRFLAYQLGLDEGVVFQGRLSHKATLQQMKASHLYLQPSLNEGFCNAVLEAQAMGLLTIASNVGGLPENIEDEKTGWLVPEGNPGVLAEKIKKVMSLTMQQQQEITQQAMNRVQEHFGILAQQKAFREFYS